MPASSPAQPSYDVQLVQCPGLAPEQRLGAESRFRAALEFALGGSEQMLMALQAYRLAQALREDIENDLEPAEVNSQDDNEDKDDADAQSLITLWEKAESDAVMAAIKPLNAEARAHIALARFEIVPHY